MALTREKIESWTPSHLEQAASWIDTQQGFWTDHFSSMLTGVQGLEWTGRGGAEALETAYRDNVHALSASTPVQEAALTLSTAAGDLTAGQHTILDLIQVAEGPPPVGGFEVTVNDGVKVQDVAFKSYSNQEMQQARQAQAQAHAMDITSAINSWQAHKSTVAAALRTHAENLAGVHMVDNRFKTDGPQEPLMPELDRDSVATGGEQTPLERGLGNLPPVPSDWWKNEPTPPGCTHEEYLDKREGLITASGGFGMALGTAEAQGPAALVTVPLAAMGLDRAADSFNKCLEEGGQ